MEESCQSDGSLPHLFPSIFQTSNSLIKMVDIVKQLHELEVKQILALQIHVPMEEAKRIYQERQHLIRQLHVTQMQHCKSLRYKIVRLFIKWFRNSNTTDI
jgi:hypothetical protein